MARNLASAIAGFILFWPLAGYPALLWLIARLRPRTTSALSDGQQLPSMTVILPTFQERANVSRRLRNLAALRYPDGLLDVIVVDSGSMDGTAEAVRSIADALGGLRVTLVCQAKREGKASAINAGIRVASGDLVVVTDAPTLFAPDALERIAARFANASVGAATGRFEVTGEGGAAQREEARFWRLRNRLRALEAAVDSTPFLSGELACFRRSLVSHLDGDTLADDMNIAMQVRRQGFRVITCDDVHFSEPRSNDAAELIETKGRRAAGGVQELIRARDMMFNPGYGLFGVLILPSAFMYYLPLRVPAALLVGAAALGWLRRLPVALQVGGIAAIAGALSLFRRSLWEHAVVFLFNEWMFLLGWQRVLRNRMDVRWAQERSTRDISREADDGAVA